MGGWVGWFDVSIAPPTWHPSSQPINLRSGKMHTQACASIVPPSSLPDLAEADGPAGVSKAQEPVMPRPARRARSG